MKPLDQVTRVIKEYLILENGDYDSFRVDILDVTNTKLKDKDILTMLNADSNDYSIAGRIKGEVSGWSCMDLFDEATQEINNLFCCYDNREYKTVLDKKYTEEELLKIATANDSSGLSYWECEIKNKYNTYLKCFDIYQKLIKEQL